MEAVLMSRRLVPAAVVALCLMVLGTPAAAQVFTGRIDVTAKDGTGAIAAGRDRGTDRGPDRSGA